MNFVRGGRRYSVYTFDVRGLHVDYIRWKLGGRRTLCRRSSDVWWIVNRIHLPVDALPEIVQTH